MMLLIWTWMNKLYFLIVSDYCYRMYEIQHYSPRRTSYHRITELKEIIYIHLATTS